jgi:glycerol uptake facilitator-like aquaporin
MRAPRRLLLTVAPLSPIQGFPLKRVPLYLFFQLLGGFVSSLMVYAMFQSEMDAYHAGLLRLGAAANSRIFSPQGPAGIIALFPPAGVPMRQSFAVEVFGDLFVGLVIAACVDGSNPFVSPAQAPFAVGLSFGVAVWGLGSFGVSLNTARDLGARFACGAIYGRECFQPAAYVASAALTNLLFTSVAFAIYMFCLSDSRRAPASVALQQHAQAEHAHYLNATRTHEELLEKKRTRAA